MAAANGVTATEPVASVCTTVGSVALAPEPVETSTVAPFTGLPPDVTLTVSVDVPASKFAVVELPSVAMAGWVATPKACPAADTL